MTPIRAVVTLRHLCRSRTSAFDNHVSSRRAARCVTPAAPSPRNALRGLEFWNTSAMPSGWRVSCSLICKHRARAPGRGAGVRNFRVVRAVAGVVMKTVVMIGVDSTPATAQSAASGSPLACSTMPANMNVDRALRPMVLAAISRGRNGATPVRHDRERASRARFHPAARWPPARGRTRAGHDHASGTARFGRRSFLPVTARPDRNAGARA